MARDFYETTIALADGAAAGTVKSLAGVKVSVVPRGAVDVPGSLIDIFQAATGVTKGPDPKSGASGTNPFTTNASGSVRFWADAPAELDLVYEDMTVPNRISDRISWNANPAKLTSTPTSVLIPDAGLTMAHMSSGVVNNMVPVGAVIEWWRPNAAVSVPTGFVICDGLTTLAVGQHDFPNWNSPVTVPDLRNLFVLGADSTKSDGVGAGGDDAVGSGPGIRGGGGSNKHTLLARESGVNDLGSTANGGAHTPTIGNLWHLGGVQGFSDTGAGPGYDNREIIVNPVPAHNHPLTARNADSPHNNMPKWVGLLRIMKVKR